MRFLFILFLPLFLISCNIEPDHSRERRRDIDIKQRERVPRPNKPENLEIDLSIIEGENQNANNEQGANQNANNEQGNTQDANNEQSNPLGHFILPIRLVDVDTNIVLHSNEERTHITIKTAPENKVFKLIAGLKGVVSMDKQVLSIVSKGVALQLELNLKSSKLLVKASQEVTKEQILGETTKPIVVSIKKDEEFIPICLKISDKTQGKVKITHTKDLSENDPCN